MHSTDVEKQAENAPAHGEPLAEETRVLYLAVLERAQRRPVHGDAEAALHAFLSLNAGYFLGEWLPEGEHHALVRRLAAGLDGIAGLPVPTDPVRALQLAQHARELADVFGPTPWTDAVTTDTRALVPTKVEDWDAEVRWALRTLTETGDGRLLLFTHARRRLWELAHTLAPTGTTDAPALAGELARIARVAAGADGLAVQVAEAALAESASAPRLAAEVGDALRGGRWLRRTAAR